MFTVVSANVNGIRAFGRRGGLKSLRGVHADVICLQEVRATDDQLAAALAESDLAGLHLAHAPAASPGRSGVAILTRAEQNGIRTSIGKAEFADTGRWVEVRIQSELGPITVVSVYVHKGDAEGERRAIKDRFLVAMTARMRALRRRETASGGNVVICGDFNIAHTELDIKNWRANVGRPGFMDSERAVLDTWFREGGWVDVGRVSAGDRPGPYTWWSWRGKAFDTDAGWRIDYQLATPGLARSVIGTEVLRAPSYAERTSDHAAVVARFA